MLPLQRNRLQRLRVQLVPLRPRERPIRKVQVLHRIVIVPHFPMLLR